MMTPSDLHYCRVLIQQARHFRLRGSPFATTLLTWAGNPRKPALALRSKGMLH